MDALMRICDDLKSSSTYLSLLYHVLSVSAAFNVMGIVTYFKRFPVLNDY